MESLLDIDLLLQVSGITPGRAATLPAVVMGLISVVFGWWALVRSSARINPRRMAAILSLVLALISMVFSFTHLARATGDFGTGSGKLGAIVAMVLALTAMVLSGIALTRLQRTGSGSHG